MTESRKWAHGYTRGPFTSLLFVKARFYTHLLEPSKKTFAWDSEDRYIISYIMHCSRASAIVDSRCAGPSAFSCERHA